MYININGMRNTCTYLSKAKLYLKNAKKELSDITVPSDFEYGASKLKSVINGVNSSINLITIRERSLKSQINKISKAEENNKSIAEQLAQKLASINDNEGSNAEQSMSFGDFTTALWDRVTTGAREVGAFWSQVLGLDDSKNSQIGNGQEAELENLSFWDKWLLSIFGKEDSDEEKDLTGELDEFFQTQLELRGKYGIDQGLFRQLKEEDYEYYKDVRDFISTRYGFSEIDAEEVMTGVDSIGACSYAMFANTIVDFFKESPDDFEKIFGFPLYRENSEGIEVINDAELLADIYIKTNHVSYGGDLFETDKNLKTTFTNKALKIDQESDDIIIYKYGNFSTQEYYSSSAGLSEDMINNYLNSFVRCNVNQIKKSSEQDLTDERMDEIVENVSEAIEQGETVTIGVYGKEDVPILFYNDEDVVQQVIESGGHAVTVTDVEEDAFVISTWGIKEELKFSNLQENGSFRVDACQYKIDWRYGLLKWILI